MIEDLFEQIACSHNDFWLNKNEETENVHF